MRWLSVFWLAAVVPALAACSESAPAPSGPALVAPDAQDLLQDKAHAFQAGVAAGERLQARHDAAAMAAAHAALVAETAAASCPTPKASAAPAAVSPGPETAPAPTYAPGGPAVPVAPAN